MNQYVTKIRTESGDLQIDYRALANLPTPDPTLTVSGGFADAKATGDAITKVIEDTMKDLVCETITANKVIGAVYA